MLCSMSAFMASTSGLIAFSGDMMVERGHRARRGKWLVASGWRLKLHGLRKGGAASAASQTPTSH